MIKINKFKSIFLVLILMLMIIAPGATVARAETIDSNENETKGIFTRLGFGLKVEDGYVKAVCKNEFTLFPTEVKVYAELYCSDTYYEFYTDMELVERVYIADLNIGEEIAASGAINGETKYWQGRFRYKIDSGDWEVKTTDSICIDSNGNVI